MIVVIEYIKRIFVLQYNVLFYAQLQLSKCLWFVQKAYANTKRNHARVLCSTPPVSVLCHDASKNNGKIASDLFEERKKDSF